jgi:hypothetical protein
MNAASLTLSYALPVTDVRVWTYASYTTNHTTDRQVDGRTVSVTGGLVRELGKIRSARASLSLEIGHDRYVDSVRPESSVQDTFGFLLFKLASF